LWNAMIVPFLPQAIAGALWYQGESNVGQTSLYACAFPAMISDWRSQFKSEFPFYFVQLAPWIGGPGTAVAELRQSQLAALTLPKVGFMSAVDLGDATSPFGDIHPRDKQTVGARLLLSALTIAYGRTQLSSPIYSGHVVLTNQNSVSINVLFQLLPTDRLVLKSGNCSTGVAANNCQNFGILLSDGLWYVPTSYSITSLNGVTVVLNFPTNGLTARTIQYGYSSWPVCTLFNSVGLPVVPFSINL